MNKKEQKKLIKNLCEKAKKGNQVFIFGDEVYTPEEVETAIFENYEDELRERELTFEEWLDRLSDCIVEADED